MLGLIWTYLSVRYIRFWGKIVEFIGSKRIHASSQAVLDLAARDNFPELFRHFSVQTSLERHTLEWPNHGGISAVLEVVPNGPSQADITLKVQLEGPDDARAVQIPDLIEAALERIRNIVEAE